MCTLKETGGRPFGPSGCQVPVGNGICGESNTLDIIDQFRKLYEDKMRQIDVDAGGDSLQEKITLQQEWINDLTEQNVMLVKAVEELEFEATQRVHMLEEKLQHSAQCICEVMKKYQERDIAGDLLAEPLQKIVHLESDVKNLLEYIRRIRESNEWSVDGLTFYEIDCKLLCGKKPTCSCEKPAPDPQEAENLLKEKERQLQELTGKVKYFNSFGNIEEICKELNCKKQECESLKQDMAEARQALTEEVAVKHDQTMQLKRDVQELEERCIQADKQTAFRDDIIKELRKEIKQLKQQEAELEFTKYTVFSNILNLQKRLVSSPNCSLDKSQILNEIKNVTQNLEFDNNTLYSKMESEINTLNKYVKIKDMQIIEQWKLINILIRRLFKVNKGLIFLQDRIKSLNCCSLGTENNDLKSKIQCMHDNQCTLEKTLVSGKSELVELEKQFQNFLRKRQQLKEKYKMSECKCKNLMESNSKLEKEMENLKFGTERCKQLLNESQNVEHQILKLNEENRNLSKTIDTLRNRIKKTTDVTREEITMLNATIEELRKNLTDSKMLQEEELRMKEEEVLNLHELVNQLKKESKICKICRGRQKVGFSQSTEVQATPLSEDEEQSDKSLITIQKKEQIIQVQNETLSIVQCELEEFKKKEMTIINELESKNMEIQHLQDTIVQLENALRSTEERAGNLQVAVDLYLNSISVLETAEEKYKMEIEQQKLTISNLQQALVSAKRELDDVRKKGEDNVELQKEVINTLVYTLLNVETQLDEVKEQLIQENDKYKSLQNINLTLEIEHCKSLQDISMLETQLVKYQQLLKHVEEGAACLKRELKNVMKQKKCYEEVVSYFKEEMAAMSEQFENLHDLLTKSIESAQDENCHLMEAFLEVQTVNEKLSNQLCICQEKSRMDNEFNDHQQSKICELKRLLSEKDSDLSKQDHAIKNIRKSLQCSLKQNEELHNTVVSLNQTIAMLQNAVQSYELENCKTKQSTEQCKSQINNCRERLVELKNSLGTKTAELLKLEMAYNNQNRQLKYAQTELREIKCKQQEGQCHLQCTLEALEKKLNEAEEAYSNLCEQHSKLQGQLATVTRREAVKDLEIRRYRQIVCDLKTTLMDLNKTLTNKELRNKCKNEECRKKMELVEQAKNQDICQNCPCEVEFYQSIVETLKKSVIDLKKKLNETQQRNKQLEEDKKVKEVQFEQLSKTQVEKEQEYNELRQKLSFKLQQAQHEETRYNELANQLEKEIVQTRQELQLKTMQLEDVKKSVKDITSSRCIQLACAQEEVNSLKDELNKMMQKHCALNCENEKLHHQSGQLQNKVTSLEERSQLLKEQVEQYLAQLQHMHVDKQSLIRKNRELLAELKAIQGCCEGFNKQQRDANESIKCLEAEIESMRCDRDGICSDGKNVISNVRAWLQEQREINEQYVRKEKIHSFTIDRLRHRYEELQGRSGSKPRRTHSKSSCPMKSGSPPPTCQSPWNLGSQGTGSLQDPDSPCGSPCPEDARDWFSPTFKNESEDEYEEDWVSKLENLTCQVRRTNRMWECERKSNTGESVVSKDYRK